MSVTVLCPNLRCKAVLHVPDNMRGQMIRCGQCGIHLSVPADRGGPAPAKDGTGGDKRQQQAAPETQ